MQKSNVRQFLSAKLQAVRFWLEWIWAPQRDLLENLKKNIFAKVTVFKIVKKGKTLPMQACNLLKMETFSNNFHETLKIY